MCLFIRKHFYNYSFGTPVYLHKQTANQTTLMVS